MDAKKIEQLKKGIAEEIAKARSNPKEYSKVYDRLIKANKGKKEISVNGDDLKYADAKKLFESSRDALAKKAPMDEELVVDEDRCKGSQQFAEKIAKDISLNDKKNDAFEKDENYGGNFVAWGAKNAEEIVTNLINGIDNEENPDFIFNKDFKSIGIGAAKSKDYGDLVLIDFFYDSKNEGDKATGKTKDAKKGKTPGEDATPSKKTDTAKLRSGKKGTKKEEEEEDEGKEKGEGEGEEDHSDWPLMKDPDAPKGAKYLNIKHYERKKGSKVLARWTVKTYTLKDGTVCEPIKSEEEIVETK